MGSQARSTSVSIPVPVTRTKIATATWGVPITNEVNRLTTYTTPTPWVNVTYQNGWLDYTGGYSPVQYRKVGDIVYVRGVMKQGALNNVAFTLPVGFRPPTIIQKNAAGTASTVDYNPSGTCYVAGGGNGAVTVDCWFSTI